jgi:unsaturated rhamnogalacturonyl hydrolase
MAAGRGKIARGRLLPMPTRSISSRRLACALVVLLLGANLPMSAQSASWSSRVADSLIAGAREPGNSSVPTLGLDKGTGLELEGLDAAWYNTAHGDYFRFVRRAVDASLNTFEGETGGGPTSRAPDPVLARQILFLYRVTLSPRYYKAAAELEHSFQESCSASESPIDRIGEGPRRPSCMSEAFLAEYAQVFQRLQDFALITRSFDRWDTRIAASSPGPGGTTTSSRGTALAWLAFALIDTLPYYPHDDPGRAELIRQLDRVASEIVAHQDAQTGLFRDWPGTAENRLPSSSACLLVYALEKGVRLQYLPASDAAPAERAWQGILRHMVRIDAAGSIELRMDRASSTSPAEPEGHGDPNGWGALLLAATEIDHASTATEARGETVMLDAWYNSQERRNGAGDSELFHYKWDDCSDSGYSLLGHMFRSFGAATETLAAEPTQDKLSRSQFYIIVSPDIPVKNPNPHYMTDQDAGEIAAWVQKGGVLVLMENDPPNADIAHLNLLAERFGIHFDDVLHHHILGEHVEDGRIPVLPDGLLFQHPHTLYMKDTCAISLRAPARPLLSDRGDVVMAAAKYGRGTVFAAVDPWLYNEYTDGRKNPEIYNQFDNFAGGEEFVRWLLQQRPR